MSIFAGLDWGASGHVVCVVDERGAIQARFEASHDAAGLAELLGRLKRIAPPEALPVAIERPPAWSSTRWSRPATRSCRSIRTS